MDRSAARGGSSEEREFAILVGELRALGEDIAAARAASARAQAPIGLSAHREPPAPRLSGEHLRLPDGAEIVIRPIEADDAPLLRLTLEHLGALSRYRRFREPVDHFSPRELDELTHADHRTREALVALDPVAGEGIGIAGYVRDDHDPEGAEVTYLVTDTWQGRGVGTALLERLAARARAAGLERFTATTLVGSEDARHLLAHVADPISEHRDGGIVEITAQLRSSDAQ
jgi:RimJ/RimL family protein N-acetyltransferase